MATVSAPRHLPRPRPAVIQGTHHIPSSSHPQSRSTASDSSAPVTPICSNPHSGESWFQVSTSDYTSPTSHSYLQPLPKGARPPSPQPFVLARDPTHPVGQLRDAKDSTRPLYRRSSSSWKLEWRGLSKIVKWAFLGDRQDEGAQQYQPRERRSTVRPHHPRGQDRDPHSVNRLYDERIRQAVPPPLSPSTSETCIDLTYDGAHMLSKSELGHGSEVGHNSAARYHGALSPSYSNASVQDIYPRGYRSHLVSGHGSHVRIPPGNPNVYHGASSEHGHLWIDESHLESGNPQADVDESVISHDSTPHWRQSAREVQSDIGHGNYRSVAPGLASSVSLSHRHGRNQEASGVRRPFSSFRSSKSAAHLPINASSLNVASDNRPRPRKLRKSMPPPPPLPPMPIIRTDDHPRGTPPPSLSPTSRTSYMSPSLTTPLSSTKSISRRKLTKRRSSATTPTLADAIARDISPTLPPRDSALINLAIENSEMLQPPELKAADEVSTAVIANVSSSTDRSLPLKRPSILRTESNRRWTVAVADVPDDFFIEELERLRRMGRLHADDLHGVRTVQAEQVETVEVASIKDGHGKWSTQVDIVKKTEREERHSVVMHTISPEEESEWLHARRAILCCRELVRTERSYQARLQELVDGNICDTAPSLLLQYIPALLDASKVLSIQFNEDMSASGVSRAFLHVESILEPAFTAWSSVVGAFFGLQASTIPSRNHKRKLTGSSIVAEEKQLVTSSGTIRLRRISARSRHETSTSYPSTPVQSASPVSASASTTWPPQVSSSQPSQSSDGRESTVSAKKSLRKKEARSQDRRRMPPFRELAILPTQRVTRYALLYKDLLKHTPLSSPARVIVEKAVDSAVSLAQKCNQAQDKALITQSI